MMILALITRPWILLTQRMSLIPRTLADDLMLCITGYAHSTSDDDDMLDTFTLGIEVTLDFIHDMGGKPSPNKSATVASAAAHRKKGSAFKSGAVLDAASRSSTTSVTWGHT